MAEAPAFAEVDRRLREILRPYRESLVTTKDGPGGLVLEIPGLEGKPWGYVAGVRSGKRHVSFYLMGVYGGRDLLDTMSPELRRRMQGKACFTFTKVDEVLFEELAALTDRSIDRFRAIAATAVAGKRPKVS